MRVLLLRRGSRGGMATVSDLLAALLPRFGIHVRLEEAESWMPKETQSLDARKSNKTLKSAAEDYDLVHAFGYRAAWACGETFGNKEAWVFTAYDFPKTTHPRLIEHLSNALECFATSRDLRFDLVAAGLEDVFIAVPGVQTSGLFDREGSRQRLELPEGQVVVAVGRFEPERSFTSLVRAMSVVWAETPDTTLVLAGDGTERELIEEEVRRLPHFERVLLLPWQSQAEMLLSAADLVVVPSKRQSFSSVVAEAMSLSKPVLLRDTPGLREMIEPETSGLTFSDDSNLGQRIAEALQMPLTLESLGSAGRIRASTVMDAEEFAAVTARKYRQLLA